MFGSYHYHERDFFDLVEEQELIRNTFDPKKLYEMWEKYNNHYKENKIGSYQLDELRDSVFAQFKKIDAAKSALD